MSTLLGFNEEKWIKHYSSSHKILLVGEGDFSFSACLARAFGSAQNMVSTSLDSHMCLACYADAYSNINELRGRGCSVIHDVDATEMAKQWQIKGNRFDRIIFNFPYAYHNIGNLRQMQLILHQNLIRLFFMNAKQLLEVGGEVHVTHKTNGFHNEWKLDLLASQSGLRLIEEVDFSLSDYPGYDNKYGFQGDITDKSFSCYPSKTFKFGHA